MASEPGERRAPEDDAPGPRPTAALRPRWMWIVFAIIALAIPLVGLWLERAR